MKQKKQLGTIKQQWKPFEAVSATLKETIATIETL
jgi:hypothetical protein